MWDLSSGDVIEHKVNDDIVCCMALSVSRDMIVSHGGGVIRVLNVSTCLLLLRGCYWFF